MKKGLARTASAALALGLSAALAACSGGGGGTPGGGAVNAGAYNGPKVTVLFWNGWTGGNQPKLFVQLFNCGK